MESHSARVPLPKNWPQGVKAAVLHIIALAHVAIVHARRFAVNSPDTRTRLAGDLQGSLDEISLLEEELRIKDGRMALIDAHRRPLSLPKTPSGPLGARILAIIGALDLVSSRQPAKTGVRMFRFEDTVPTNWSCQVAAVQHT